MWDWFLFFELSFFGLLKGVVLLRSDYVFREEFQHLLAALTPENRLALEVSLCSGLRISDVLNLRSCKLAPRMTVRELKTGKSRRVYLPVELLDRLRGVAGKVFVFENRRDYSRPRTRQAVYKDLKRAAKLFRMPADLQLSPHSARKIFAVTEFQRGRDLHRVKELLNHSSEAVTLLYAMADQLTLRHRLPRA